MLSVGGLPSFIHQLAKLDFGAPNIPIYFSGTARLLQLGLQWQLQQFEIYCEIIASCSYFTQELSAALNNKLRNSTCGVYVDFSINNVQDQARKNQVLSTMQVVDM